MIGQVVAILALILSQGQQPQLLLIGHAALWVVVVTALVSAFDYFRRFNFFMYRAAARDNVVKLDRKAG
jgi:hypothetical protein